MYKKITTIFPYLIGILLFCNSCLGSEDDKLYTEKVITMYVSSEMDMCYGMYGEPTECMLVKEQGESEYEPFPYGIGGFEYKKGFEYELLVNKKTYRNPPADGGCCSYELLEIKSCIEWY